MANENKQALAARLKAVEQATANKQAERHTNARPAGLATGTPAAPAAAPRYRAGESALTSRGYRYCNAFGVQADRLKPEQAKVEMMAAEMLHKGFAECGIHPSQKGGFWVPFATSFLPEGLFRQEQLGEIRQMVKAGGGISDLDEVAWMQRKAVTGGMSWLDQQGGGALVGPPEFGELITLFRNEAAVTAAGATVIPLPPTGRIQFPRQIGVTTGSWVGEATDATKSYPQTGTLTLSAKKCISLVVMPNELLRFATVAAENLVRTDLTKTLALTADLAFLDGEGGDIKPHGLLGTSGIGTVTPTTTHADGDTLSPQDVYAFISEVMKNNAKFEGFVLRPELFFKFVQARAAVYNGSTTVAQGQYVFDQFRSLGDGFAQNLGGFKATLSNNVPKNRAKGSGTTLTPVIGGMWSNYMIAMLGAVEFAQTDGGITLLQADQAAIRGIMVCDGGAKNPGAFAVADHLLTAVGA